MNYKYFPFINSLIGGILDFISTFYALNILNLGFYETHLTYNFFIALAIFTLMNLAFYFLIPNTKKFLIVKVILSCFIYLGFINNILNIAYGIGFYYGLPF